jgi:hypothetical protein
MLKNAFATIPPKPSNCWTLPAGQSAATVSAAVADNASQRCARAPQFRFTVRLSGLLGSIEAVGCRRERGDSVFMESVVAPAILVSAMPVQVVVAS